MLAIPIEDLSFRPAPVRPGIVRFARVLRCLSISSIEHDDFRAGSSESELEGEIVELCGSDVTCAQV